MPRPADFPRAHRLGETFAHLNGAGRAQAVPVGEDFWSRAVFELPPGRLVSAFRTDTDWTSWEVHPAGDELVYQISGAIELILELPEGELPVRLAAGEFLIVPAGVWHTADVVEPGEALFITPGEGTDHRPR